MKTIGLIGGLSWLSTLDYYRILNEMINEKLGGSEAAKIIIYSVNFGEIKTLIEEDRWDKIAGIICNAAKKIEVTGADCILIGANTMHKIANEVLDKISIPLIHVAEEVAKKIKEKKLSTVALLGTKYTMQMDFYKDKLFEQGIVTIIPDGNEINFINTAIYDEMGKGIFLSATKEKVLRIINRLNAQGAQGIILGCTELPILIKQEDCEVPVFDTTRIHAESAVEFALK